MEYEIKEFVPQDVSDDFWDIYFEFIFANSKYDNPDDPLPNKEAVIQRQKHQQVDYIVKRWIGVTPDNKVIAWAGFGTSAENASDYEQNKDKCNVAIRVHHDYYRKGIGTEMLKTLVYKAIEHKIRTIETGTNHDSGRAFLKHFGAQLTIEGAENRLEIKDVDWKLMKEWIDKRQINANDVIIESFEECPDNILNEYAEMFTEALNMQPLGETEQRANLDGEAIRLREKRLKEIGRKQYTLITREKDGRVSGLTEIEYDSREAHVVRQELTAVRPEFRGRGLGKWLKAQMIFYIKENYPEAEMVSTGNAEGNAPMLSINKRMGFKKYKGGEAYKFKIKEISKKLGL